MKNTFIFKNNKYKVSQTPSDISGIQSDEWLTDQIQFAINNGDFTTVKSRIVNGEKWGWLKQIL